MNNTKIPFLINLATYLTKNTLPVIYVAGKITGLPYKEVQDKFKAAQIKLEAQGFKVLNPCEFMAIDENWHTAMRKASTMLNMSDHIYLLPDWKDSEGARFEFAQAVKFDISCINES
jgi:hypothetical protein